MKLSLYRSNLKKKTFIQLIGYIDRTYIPITAPREGYRDFVNRKEYIL